MYLEQCLVCVKCHVFVIIYENKWSDCYLLGFSKETAFKMIQLAVYTIQHWAHTNLFSQQILIQHLLYARHHTSTSTVNTSILSVVTMSLTTSYYYYY